MKKCLITLSVALGLFSCSDDKNDDAGASKSTLTLVGGGGSAATTLLAQTPASAKMKIYEFKVSKNKDCSDPVSVFTVAEGKEVDMLASPEIGSGELAHGAYECVVLVMADQIKFTPSATDGACVKDQEVTVDLCSPTAEAKSSVDPAGTETTCTDGADKVHLYISTAAQASNGLAHAFERPLSNNADKGVNLGSKLVMSAALTGQLNMDVSDKVTPSADDCTLGQPTFSFTKINTKKGGAKK